MESREVTIKWGDKKTKVLPKKLFTEFVLQIKDIYRTLSELFKLHYVDADGDPITVTHQEDYDVALSSTDIKDLEFVVTSDDTSLKIVYPAISQVFPENPRPELNDVPLAELAPKTLGPEKPKAKTVLEQLLAAESVYFDKSEMTPCIACEGRKISKKDSPCKKCNGTGQMNASLLKYFQKRIKEETSRVILEESQKQSQLLASSKKLDDILETLKEPSYVGKSLTCTQCKNIINETIYICQICENYCLCQECESVTDHSHALIKKQVAGRRKDCYKVKVTSEENGVQTLEMNQEFYKIWTLENVGNRKLPKSTALVVKGENNLKGSLLNIGEVEPGHKFDIIQKLTVPNKSGSFVQVFHLVADGKEFGEQLLAEVKVKAPQIEEEKKRPPIQPEFPVALGKGTKIAKIYDKLKKEKTLPDEMNENFILLMQMGDWDPLEVIKQLKVSGNNLDKAINSLIPE